MYRIYFKTKDSAVMCECSNISYSSKDSCVHLSDGNALYKCFYEESEINNMMISCIKNGYLSFGDKIFSLDS